MNPSSSQIDKSLQQPQPTSDSLHSLSPHIKTQSLISLNGNQIPLNQLKRRLKHLSKVTFDTPTTNSFWDNLAAVGKSSDIKRLKKTAEFMQNTKILTNLSLPLKTIALFDFKYAISRFQYLHNLSVLDLKTLREYDFTPSNLKMLYHALSTLKHLNSLSLDFPQLSRVPLQLIDSVMLPLQRLPSLVQLSFEFTSFAGFGDLHVKRLASHLCKLNKLQSLILNFHLCSDITNIGLQPLSKTFQNLPSLLDVNIELLNSKGSSTSTINDIFSSLATCKSLKRLGFFAKPDSDCDLDSIEPISLGLNMLNPHSLREFSFKLYPDFTHYGFIQFSQALKRFSSLTALSINFLNQSCISDQDLTHFRDALQTLTSLSSLSISSLWSEKYSKSIELISQGFGVLTQLQNLSLGYSGCVGKHATIQTLASNLKNLKFLRQLNLRLDSCQFISDADLDHLSQAFRELNNITDLFINLANIGGLTNKGLESLFSKFSTNFPKLTHFTLKLANNSTNDDLLKIIAQGIQGLPALYRLDLAFPYVEESSYDEGFANLCEVLQNLASLKKIILEVKRTNFALENIMRLEKVKSVTMTWIWY